MKKSADLKKRLDVLRNEPELPIEVIVRIDGKLHRMLEHLADQEQRSLEAYILSVLSTHVESTEDDEVG